MTAEGDVDRIVRDQFFPGVTSGVMVDVGAAHPEYLSVSASFRRLGWRVIAIEPNPTFAAAHRAAGNEVLEYACADYDRDGEPFVVVDQHGKQYQDGHVTFESFSALGGIDPGYAAHARELGLQLDTRTIRVNVRKLDTLLATFAPDVTGIDVLSADVEGGELAALRGLSFERYRPKVAIVENFRSSPAHAQFMAERGYRLWKLLFPNEVFVLGELL